MKERAAELLNLAKANGAEDSARELVEDLAFIEEQLAKLRGLPFIKIDANNPERQKATPAAKQYKDLLQQYTAGLKVFLKLCGDDAEEQAESPLRIWLKERTEKITK